MIGLTRQEYLELCHRHDLPEFPRSIYKTNPSYPKSAGEAAAEMRTRGYKVTSLEKLKNLVRRNGWKTDEGKMRWSEKLIDEACEYYESQGDFWTYSEMCKTWDLSYADFLRALQTAYDATIANSKYGPAAQRILGGTASEAHFTLHLETANHDGKGRIWFTLRDDVKAKLDKLNDRA